ncbi:MAG: C39 family peptidase [Anaerolineaceae bacterium]|nr:C39 family peptidase [Anaerolineaceae bacterium]
MQYPSYIPYSRKKHKWLFVLMGLMGVVVVFGLLIYGVARVNRLINYRLDIAITYVRKLINPVSSLPTPAVKSEAEMPEPAVITELSITMTPEPTAVPQYTPTATLVPTPIPDQLQLTPPEYDEVRDKQDWNNCGPATMALYLRFFGWEGDQFDISKVIKPTRDDRNVNVEELVFYVRTETGWLNAEFRVGGDIDTLKHVIAAGIPVMIEETFTTDRKYWPGDDQWSGHYLLITGYDDSVNEFTVHDSEKGPNQRLGYAELDDNWQSFNRVYIMVYLPENEVDLQRALGENWNVSTNRQNALEDAQREAQEDPNDAFAWFNIGTNLTYFEKHNDAAAAYDTARKLGLPQRMLRYQFGPFISYFHSLQTEEVMALTKFALKITRTSEEAMLWRGWAEYRQGNKETALNYFRDALRIRPDYVDAIYAIDFVNAH